MPNDGRFDPPPGPSPEAREDARVEGERLLVATGLSPAQIYGQYQRAIEQLGVKVLSDGRGLPDVLAGHWDTDEGSGMAKAYLADHPTRERLCGGQFSDMNVAFRIAMLHRSDLDFEGRLAMAKDRIRWLSAQLARRLQEIQVWAEMQVRDRTRLREAEGELRAIRESAGQWAEAADALEHLAKRREGLFDHDRTFLGEIVSAMRKMVKA